LLDKDYWDPLQGHGEGRALIDFKSESWPVSIALDFLGSACIKEEDPIHVPGSAPVLGDWKASTDEFDIGVRKYWGAEAALFDKAYKARFSFRLTAGLSLELIKWVFSLQ